MEREEFIRTVNRLGEQRVPFLFVVDFEIEKPLVLPLDSIDPSDILYNINGFSNCKNVLAGSGSITEKSPESFARYQQRFDVVFRHLNYGDSYLTNLTVKTPVVLSDGLKQIFHAARASYKLLFKNEFLVFSPESFIRIENGKIFSFPMKGTIDASVADAARIILEDTKELAEHVTIVDLIRNDLSLVSDNVRVMRFRYVEEIRTREKNLLQVSSEICGDLPDGYLARLGDILITLLPAGSVSGAPKPRTLEIIRDAEMEKRGYYTGVFGYFDGARLDSGVMIRFIENRNGSFFYRSGGGITTQSSPEKEYQEIIDKVYVPVD